MITANLRCDPTSNKEIPCKVMISATWTDYILHKLNVKLMELVKDRKDDHENFNLPPNISLKKFFWCWKAHLPMKVLHCWPLALSFFRASLMMKIQFGVNFLEAFSFLASLNSKLPSSLSILLSTLSISLFSELLRGCSKEAQASPYKLPAISPVVLN